MCAVWSAQPAPSGHVGVWWVAPSYINSQRAERQAGRWVGGKEDIDRKGKYSLLVAHHFLCVCPTLAAHVAAAAAAATSRKKQFVCSEHRLR